MSQEDQHKSEKATPFKLREARQKGQVAKSQDMNSFAVFLASFFALYLFGNRIIEESAGYFSRTIIMASDIELSISTMQGILENIIYEVASILWPFVVTIVLATVAINFIQIGPIFSLHNIKPNAKRLNPIEGWKKIFSKKTLIEFIKTVFRIAIMVSVSLIIYDLLSPNWYDAVSAEAIYYPHIILQQLIYLVGSISLAYILIGLLDLIFVKWDYMKRMMMSRRELKEEYKRREGNPDIKAKRKEIQKNYLLGNKASSDVAGADVVITNPTRLAIAIKYDNDVMPAPYIVAKGKGYIARKIRDIATQSAVPIIENKPLAKVLIDCQLNQFIPQSVYADVAKILAMLIKRKAGALA